MFSFCHDLAVVLLIERTEKNFYTIKEFVQPKMSLKSLKSLKSREFLFWKERGRGNRAGRLI
jgi:hypothetical protein